MMKNVLESPLDMIGSTPLVRLHKFEKQCGAVAEILVKIESRNPGGSVKDRVAAAMIADAENRGVLHPGGTIVEPTSGNTGVGIALMAAARGYNAVLTMPETMSMERRRLLSALGATIVLTPGKDGMKGAIAEAEHIRDTTPGAIILGQFTNPANPAAHYATTGPEIAEATGGKVDIFVSAVGTGGTVSGTGRYLKEHCPGVVVVAVEPAESPVLEGGEPGAHGIQGIGAGFVPDTYDASVVDRVMSVTTQEALEAARRLPQTEGILAGISSGAALAAACRLAQLPANAGKRIVVILPDSGERYLSTSLYL